MSESEKIYRAEADRCCREAESRRRAILKAEEWSAEHNDGWRGGGGSRFTEEMPREIAWLEKDARRFTRLANKARHHASPSLSHPSNRAPKP